MASEHGGTFGGALDTVQVDRILSESTIELTAEMLDPEKKSEHACPICLIDVVESAKRFCLIEKCQHIVHTECLAKWFVQK